MGPTWRGEKGEEKDGKRQREGGCEKKVRRKKEMKFKNFKDQNAS